MILKHSAKASPAAEEEDAVTSRDWTALRTKIVAKLCIGFRTMAASENFHVGKKFSCFEELRRCKDMYEKSNLVI